MQPDRPLGAIVRFGPFEVDLEQRVLRKNGMRIKLQAQPFQVLSALLEVPGTVVSRDELRRRIWPEDTFVDFEHGLNAAVTRLRQALSDSADKPRYVETLPKHGYRFSAPVEAESAGASTDAVLSPPVGRLIPRAALWIGAIALVAGVSATVLAYLRPPLTGPQTGDAVPLTTFRGSEAHPALSRDGSHVAFVWNGEKEDNFDIYVMRIGLGAPLRLTSDAADDASPAWSPDGRTLAFIRRLSFDRGELVLIPASGGPEHKIAGIRNQELRTLPARLLSLAWSPDGRWIAATHRGPEDAAERIYLFSLTGEAQPLTTSVSAFGDHTPAFSPNGRALAFSRLSGYTASEVAMVPLDANFRPVGQPRLVTSGKQWSVNPAWTSDGSGILYLSKEGPAGRLSLRSIAVSGSQTSTLIATLRDEPFEISAGRHLVYTRKVRDTNIWRARIPPSGESGAKAETFLSSTWLDGKPRYSPDGKRIAFTSSRSGSEEIWVSKADGTDPVRLTSFGGPLVGHANWSPDGQWLIFHARPEGQADVFVMPAVGGTPRRMTAHPADDVKPSFSSDGRWINFASARSGREEIWRMSASGKEPVQLTTSGGCNPLESVDGRSVFYIGKEGSGVQSVPVGGGESRTVVGPLPDYVTAFAVTAEGIYYPAPEDAERHRVIRFFRFSSGENRPVAVAKNPFGMTVSPDSKYVVFDQSDALGSDLMLVENFRLR